MWSSTKHALHVLFGENNYLSVTFKPLNLPSEYLLPLQLSKGNCTFAGLKLFMFVRRLFGYKQTKSRVVTFSCNCSQTQTKQARQQETPSHRLWGWDVNASVSPSVYHKGLHTVQSDPCSNICSFLSLNPRFESFISILVLICGTFSRRSKLGSFPTPCMSVAHWLLGEYSLDGPLCDPAPLLLLYSPLEESCSSCSPLTLPHPPSPPLTPSSIPPTCHRHAGRLIIGTTLAPSLLSLSIGGLITASVPHSSGSLSSFKS